MRAAPFYIFQLLFPLLHAQWLSQSHGARNDGRQASQKSVLHEVESQSVVGSHPAANGFLKRINPDCRENHHVHVHGPDVPSPHVHVPYQIRLVPEVPEGHQKLVDYPRNEEHC